MIRIVAYLVIAAAIMVGVVWLAERPGDVTIVWQGWRIEMSVGVLAGAVVLIATLTALIYRFWRALVAAPRQFARWRRDRRQRLGYEALSSGLVAVAAGDPSGARKQARRADAMLGHPPLTLLLSAQAAQLSGDEDTAQRHFQAMLERPETEFLGVRGLLSRAMRDHDQAAALPLARRAMLLRPKTPWVLTTLLDLQTRAGDWSGAADTLDRAIVAKVLPPGPAQRHRAAAAIELSRQALADGRLDDARRAAKRAYRTAPDHPAVAAWFASRLADTDRRRRAAKLIEQEWARRPHPELIAIYRRARAPSSVLSWVKDVERLAAEAPAHPDSARALGEASLEAGLWGEARKHLTAAIAAAGNAPPATLCRKMAQVEESDSGNQALAHRWLELAAEGNPDPAWICEICGAPHAAWQATCRRCGAFDRLEWRVPDRVGSGLIGADATPIALPNASDTPTVSSSGPGS